MEDEQVREARMASQAMAGGPGLRKAHWGLTAGALMTAPAVTIHPDATIPMTAQVMTSHHIRRLPVVGEDGHLIGLVTRRDLLRVFLRSDEEVAERVRASSMTCCPRTPPASRRLSATAWSSSPATPGRPRTGTVPLAIRLIWDVDGVIDVSASELTSPEDAVSG